MGDRVELTEQDRQDLEKLNAIFGKVGKRERKKARVLADAEKRIQAIRDEVAGKLDPGNEKTKRDLDEATVIVSRLVAEGKADGKSLTLRNGVVSVRTTSSIEIVDKALLKQKALARGIWMKISVPKPREAQKTLIDKLFTARPEVTAWLSGGAKRVETTRMTVKLPKVTADIQRDLHPLRTTIPESS